MLIDGKNIPADKTSEIKCLVAIKGQFEVMAAMISTGELSTESQINGYVWSVIDEATESLEG